MVSRPACRPELCRMGSKLAGVGRGVGASQADGELDLPQVISPGWGDGKSAVPVTSFVACSRAVFRSLEWIVTSRVCSFHSAARSG